MFYKISIIIVGVIAGFLFLNLQVSEPSYNTLLPRMYSTTPTPSQNLGSKNIQDSPTPNPTSTPTPLVITPTPQVTHTPEIVTPTPTPEVIRVTPTPSPTPIPTSTPTPTPVPPPTPSPIPSPNPSPTPTPYAPFPGGYESWNSQADKYTSGNPPVLREPYYTTIDNSALGQEMKTKLDEYHIDVEEVLTYKPTLLESILIMRSEWLRESDPQKRSDFYDCDGCSVMNLVVWLRQQLELHGLN